MDERQPEEKEMKELPQYRVWLCGPFRLERRVGDHYEEPDGKEWGGRGTARTVLKVLLCAPGRQMRRSTLMDRVWPHATGEQASRNLSVALSFLRKVFDSRDPSTEIFSANINALHISVAGQAVVWVDVDAAFSLLNEVDQVGEQKLEKLLLLEKAFVYLNRGTFLVDEEEHWSTSLRTTVERKQYQCWIWLAEAYTQQGRWGQAEAILNGLLSEDPTDEDVICRLMMLLHRQGLTHQALTLYKQSHNILMGEEGLELSEATKMLAERLAHERDLPILLERFSVADPSILTGTQTQEFQVQIRRVEGTTIPHFSQNKTPLSPFLQTIAQDIIQAMYELEGTAPMAFDFSRRKALQKIAGALLLLTGASNGNTTEMSLELQSYLSRLGSFAPISALSEEEVLAHLEQLLMHSWQLGKGTSQDMLIAKTILTHCFSSLETLVRQPSPHQKRIADLVARLYNLKALLGYHTESFLHAEMYASQAVAYSQIADNADLLVASLARSALIFFYEDRPAKALEKCLEASQYLEKVGYAEQSFLYRIWAACQAQLNYAHQALTTLDLAQKTFSQHASGQTVSLCISHDPHELLLWKGITHSLIDQSDTAFLSLQSVPYAQPSPDFPERVRTGFLTNLLFAELRQPHQQRDLERCLTLWNSASKAAFALKSVLRSYEVTQAYHQLEAAFPRDPRLKELREHLREQA